MKIPISPLIWVALGVNVLCLGVVAATTVNARLKSDTAITERAKSLTVLSKHVLSDTCWKSTQPQPFKLGDSIVLNGSEDGRSPTSCIYAPKTNQFIFLAYSNGQLVVDQVYSRKEVRSQISLIKQQRKKGE